VLFCAILSRTNGQIREEEPSLAYPRGEKNDSMCRRSAIEGIFHEEQCSVLPKDAFAITRRSEVASKVFTMKKVLLLAILAAIYCPSAATQQYGPRLYQDLTWRMIGPFRGGRTRAVAGVPSKPNVFYIGAVNGGVWRSDDYGRTWTAIFDDQPTQSIGAIAVAPSSPKILYVATGEGLQRPDLSTGNGIYKSTDGGKTWTHLGLRDGEQIPALAIDPSDPDRIFAAVLGHPYG
jgi:hypothetical protein